MDQPPVFRLPPDLLYKILIDIWREEIQNYHPELGDPSPRFAINISHVCRQWRTFALDSSILWSSIKFSQKMIKDRSTEQIEEWLERSRTAGLDIEMPYTGSNRYISQVMKILLPHVERWKSFKVPRDLKPTIIRTIFDDLRHCSSSMLETLEFNAYDMRQWMFQPFSGGAPNLRTLSISLASFKPNMPIFTGLTHLQIGTWGVTEHSRQMKLSDIHTAISLASPTLQELILGLPNYVNPVPEGKVDLLPITMPNLHTIVTSGVEQQSLRIARSLFEPLYKAFVMPFLGTISLPFPLLQSLIRENALDVSLLEKVSLSLCGMDAAQIFPILDKLPRLRSLQLTHIVEFQAHLLEDYCYQLCELEICGLRRWWPPIKLMGISKSLQARRQRVLLATGHKDTLCKININWVQLEQSEVSWLESHVGTSALDQRQTVNVRGSRGLHMVRRDRPFFRHAEEHPGWDVSW